MPETWLPLVAIVVGACACMAMLTLWSSAPAPKSIGLRICFEPPEAPPAGVMKIEASLNGVLLVPDVYASSLPDPNSLFRRCAMLPMANTYQPGDYVDVALRPVDPSGAAGAMSRSIRFWFDPAVEPSVVVVREVR